MELIKKNVHMNKLKCKTDMQLTFDDDFNVPDVKPDINRIIKEQCDIRIHEVKPSNGKISLKGELGFNILYLSEDDMASLHNMMGEIQFEELVNLDEVKDQDILEVKWDIEDLNTSLINSRKISVKSIVCFTFYIEDVYDEETAVALEGDDNVYYQNKRIEITQLAVNKKDTLRIKDGMVLPSNKPNIFDLLYYDMVLKNTEERILQDKISIKGEIGVFLLYMGEEDNVIQFIETEIPFSEVIDCNGCTEDMIPDVDIRIQSKEMEIKPDSDGEERILEIEVVLELGIKGYLDEEIEILRDMYSTTKELIQIPGEAQYERLLVKNHSKNRVIDQVKVGRNEPKILQINNASGTIKIDDIILIENGVEVNGIIEVQILYLTEEDRIPMNSLKCVIPFTQNIEAKGMNSESRYQVKPNIEQISVTMLDSEEIEIKATINLSIIVFEPIVELIIKDMRIEEIDLDKLQNMPSMIGYIVKAGDSLWKIAKKYYTTVDIIREMNDMAKDEVMPGDKILILKKIDDII